MNSGYAAFEQAELFHTTELSPNIVPEEGQMHSQLENLMLWR